MSEAGSVQLVDVTKTFGAVTAVDHLDLTVNPVTPKINAIATVTLLASLGFLAVVQLLLRRSRQEAAR